MLYMFLSRVLRIGLLICGLTTFSQAVAQPSGAKGEHFLYRVVQGDTLGEVAQRYTTDYANWSILQQMNGVEDPYRLPVAKMLHIPFSMIPTRASPARVQHVTGRASVDGRPLGADALVGEGQTIQTESNGYVALQLADDSVVTIPPSSSVQVSRLQQFVGAGLSDSILHMAQGSIESRVAPNNTGVGRFEVRTPVSVTGVRGTNLRVHAASDGSRSEVISGMAGVDASATPEVVLRPQQGLAVGSEGQSLGVQQLLGAPQLATPARGPGGWMASFEPIDGAAAYVVSVARDAYGVELVSRQTIQTPPARFAASGPGTHYVFVRAIDEFGMGGVDASASFEGAFVLLDGTGAPVLAGDGNLIVVADY